MVRHWFRKTPLAWLQVKREKTRLLVAIAGISFADMLIFLQMGFQGALYDAAVKPHRSLKADLVVINPQFKTLVAVKSFAREHLYQTLAHPSVASVQPLYIGTGQWRNPETRLDRPILVWGVDPVQPSFNLPDVNQHFDTIKPINQVLFDQNGRPEYGPIGSLFQQSKTVETELNSKVVQVSQIFALGASFAADGNVIASDSTFLNLFPDRKPEHIDVGLITLQPGSDIEQVRSQLTALLPKDVVVLTREGFAQVEKTYWANSTGIGFIFGLGVGVGFIVGIVIVYQILYSDVSDHLPEYATLKAMGYSNNYLLSVLLQEALLLALLGYLPSILLSFGLYQLAQASTLLPIAMKLDRAIAVLVLTIIMCAASGAIASRKLRSADPADVFA